MDALFLIFAFLSIIWCRNNEAVLYGTRGILECFLVGVALISYTETKNEILNVFRYMIVSGLLLIIKIFITTPISDILARNMTGDFNPNTVGIKIAINLLIIFWFIKEKIHISSFYKLISVVFIVMTVLTGSKKAIFVLAIGIVLILFVYANNPLKVLKVLIVVCVGIGIGYWLLMNNNFLYQTVGKRIEGMFNAYKYGSVYGDASTFERMNLIAEAMEAWRDQPWIGYGINTFSYISSLGMYTHNNYVELLFSLGIIGISIYYSFFAWILMKLLKYLRTSGFSAIFFAVIVNIIICDYGMVSYGNEYIQCWLALSSAFIVIHRYQKSGESKSNEYIV